MPTALPWFVVFTLARYRPRNALMNVITDKRSRYAGRRYLTAAGIALSSLARRILHTRIDPHPAIGKSQLEECAAGYHRGNVSLSFNERLDTKTERKIAFSVRGAQRYFFFTARAEAGRVKDKASLRFSSKYGSDARQRPKCSYFRLGCRQERLLIFFFPAK